MKRWRSESILMMCPCALHAIGAGRRPLSRAPRRSGGASGGLIVITLWCELTILGAAFFDYRRTDRVSVNAADSIGYRHAGPRRYGDARVLRGPGSCATRARRRWSDGHQIAQRSACAPGRLFGTLVQAGRGTSVDDACDHTAT